MIRLLKVRVNRLWRRKQVTVTANTPFISMIERYTIYYTNSKHNQIYIYGTSLM